MPAPDQPRRSLEDRHDQHTRYAMSAAIISAVFGSVILAVLGWIIQQMNHQFGRLDHRIDDLGTPYRPFG